MTCDEQTKLELVCPERLAVASGHVGQPRMHPRSSLYAVANRCTAQGDRRWHCVWGRSGSRGGRDSFALHCPASSLPTTPFLDCWAATARPEAPPVLQAGIRFRYGQPFVAVGRVVEDKMRVESPNKTLDRRNRSGNS